MRGFPRATSGRAVVVLAVTGLLVGACGGQEPVAPRQWAASVCGVVKPWSGEVRRLQAEAQQKVDAKADVQQTKTQLITLFGGMAQATETALAGVRGAGVPDVEEGTVIADHFRTALSTARDSFAKGRNEVAKLPTDDPAAFYDGVATVGGQLSEENDKASRAFTRVSSPELDKAFDTVAECR